MILTTDDLSVDNLVHFKYWDLVKVAKPETKLVAFTIAEGINQDNFLKWWEARKDWVEIGVHGFNHTEPQEGWRDDQEIYWQKSLDILRPFLPERPLFRAPGFRVLNKTEKIIREMGFRGIAHQRFIKYFDTGELVPVFNTHCTEDKFLNPIGKVWKQLA